MDWLMRLLDARCLAAVLAFAVSGCSMLPSGAPTVSQITRPAAPAGIAIHDIVEMDALPAAPPTASDWPIGDAAPWSGEIVPGDLLTITVFEVGYTLFAAPSDGPARGSGVPAASARALPRMEVAESGTVAIPYVGMVQAAGRPPASVAREIEQRLRGISQNAQVLVSVERGPAQSVVVSGDVRNPGRQPLTMAGERLLDVIAQAGGPANRPADTSVRLVRGGQSADIRLDRLRIDDLANVRLAPGDHIELRRGVRSVTVLGSARTVSELPFESDDLSLAEAIARSGGPLDDRADATGVFVFRFEPSATPGDPRMVPVIYRLNLLDPRSYFASQRFAMQPKDVLLIANSRSAQFGKLVQMLNNLVSPAITVDLLTR